MKRSLVIFIVLALCLGLTACGGGPYESSGEGLSVIATSFPSFDFTREIGGERVKVTLLVPPGAETHSFEPTPQDIIRIENCDLLVCAGGDSEAWLETVLEGQSGDINKITMLDCVNALEEEHKEGMQISRRHEQEHAHEHEEEEHEEDHVHDREEKHVHAHHHEFDEHVWCSPVNADKICREICLRLTELDPAGAEYYLQNYRDYSEKLMELDSEFREAVENGKSDTLIFADRFPVRYFVEEYGLDYYAAFPGCADDVEPSAKTVAFLIDMVRENHVPAVLHIEFSNEKMADIICEETGCKKLLFHSCHNVTRQELDDGVSYLELMRQNVLTVKEALS